MAIVHADNFSLYGTSTAFMLDGIYAEASQVSLPLDPDGISGGRVLLVSPNGASSYRGVRYVLPASQERVGISMRVWFASLPSGSAGTVLPMQWRNAANGSIATLTVESTGRLTIRNPSFDSTAIFTTDVPVIAAGGWYHLEGWLDCTADTFELRVEGQTVINTAFVATGPVAQLWVGLRTSNTSAGHAYYVKDFVVCNGAGSNNNTFLGTVLVTSLIPDADVNLNWTPSSGSTGFSILDNSPPVDTTFISAPNPPPLPYQGNLSNLPPDVTSVKGLITFVRAAKTDGGDGSLQVSLISDPAGTANTSNGADRPITIAQSYWRDVFELDPKTGALWTPASVDNVNLKINRTL